MKLLPRTTFLIALLLAGAAQAQTYRVEKIAEGPPQELAPAIRQSLAQEGVRILGPDGPYCELWFRKDVPAKASPAQALGITFGQIEEGTLVGAVRFLATGSDYRRLRIPPGVFTLRYSLHPVDGNHLGVAPQRDFLLLSPAAADSAAPPVPPPALYDLSRKASGAGHPSVLSLGPGEGGPETLPALVHLEEENHWVLHFKLLVGGKKMRPALVVIGHAAEA
jgi:hypothetical protein